jgi:hypothetical protein
MVIFQMLFESGFQMQNGGQSIRKPDESVQFSNGQPTFCFFTIRKLDRMFLTTSLDRFIIKYVLFMTPYL